MPRANWGIEASEVDDFDRDSQYTPYTGPMPPRGGTVYQWKIKVAKFIAGDRKKFPQLRLGLELAPRAEYDEKQYKGYFVMAFIPVSDRTQFRYVPFLDAIGVSGADFKRRTLTDEEGNIRRIGDWRNDGKTLVLAELKDGRDQDDNPRAEIGWIGAADSSNDVDTEDEEEYDDTEYEEEEEAPRRKTRSTPPRRGTTARRSPRSRRSTVEDDDF